MNKKKIALIATLVAGITLFTATALASTQTTSGYETLKSAVKEMKNLDSGKVNGTFSLKDNGQTVLDASGNAKINKESKEASGNFSLTSTNISKALSFSGDKSNVIVFDQEKDKYFSFNPANESMHDTATNHCNSEMTATQEKILDTLVGKYKEQFELATTSDGLKQVSFNLSQDEIPAILQLMASSGINHDNMNGENVTEQNTDLACLEDFKDLHENLPKLTSDIKINEFEFTATIDDNNVIKSNTIKLVVTGNDVDGKMHSLEFNGTLQYQQDSAVAIDSIDTTGKNVQTIQAKKHIR